MGILTGHSDPPHLLLDGSQDSLSAALNVLDDFGEVSGIKLNCKKTETLWIGSNSGRNKTLAPERNFRWQKDKAKSLGRWFSTDPDNTVFLNYKEKLEKIRTIPSNWKYRRLTLTGKVIVLKSLVAFQIATGLRLCPSVHKRDHNQRDK